VSNLNHLLQRQCDADFDFVVVGGFAAMLHGSALRTRDLDVCAAPTRANTQILQDLLRDLHP